MRSYKTLVASALVAISPAFAQTGAPSSAPAAGDSVWPWVVAVLLVVAVIAWYFWSRSRRTPATEYSAGIDRDRIEGSAKQAKGSIEETAGHVLGDTKLRAEGTVDKVEGRAQNTAGGIRDTMRGH